MAPHISSRWIQFFNHGYFFSIYCLFNYFSKELFGIILKYFVISKEFCSLFISLDTLDFFWIFFFCFNFSFIINVLSINVLYFLLIFSCFPSFPFGTLTYFIKYGYFFLSERFQVYSSSPCNSFFHVIYPFGLFVPVIYSKKVLLHLYLVVGISSGILYQLVGRIFFRYFRESCFDCIAWKLSVSFKRLFFH